MDVRGFLFVSFAEERLDEAHSGLDAWAVPEANVEADDGTGLNFDVDNSGRGGG